MAYRLVYEEFWTDPKTLEEMTPEDKYFYLYLLTNPNTTMIGIYKITKKQMAFELGYSIESVNSLLDRFQRHHQLVHYNDKTREVVIKNWGKYNLNKGGKPVFDCIRKDLRQVDDKNLINFIIDGIKNPLIKQLFADSLPKEIDDSLTIRDTNGGTTGGQYQIPNTKYLIPNTNTTTTTINNNIDINLDNEDEFVDMNSCRSAFGNILVFKHYEKCGFIMSPKLMEFISADIEIYGTQWVMQAAEVAVKSGKYNNYGYVKGILQNWYSKGKEDSNRGGKNGTGCNSKNNGENKYEGFRPAEPKLLSESELRAAESELI